MTRLLTWKAKIGLLLVGLSLLLALLHVAIFRDARTFEFYLALDIAFVPVQVLLVTLIIEQLLNQREKAALLDKLNMVIGAFFSQLGTELIRRVVRFCAEAPELEKILAVAGQWGPKEYQAAAGQAGRMSFHLTPNPAELESLRDFLLRERPFMLGLLQNPNLLEHEAFTDLLWALTHLSEELEARPGFIALPGSDLAHLGNDLGRAFGLLIREWLAYLQHLKEAYPYIYSLALRTNPFLPQTSAVVQPS
jgi:hypothetical protein